MNETWEAISSNLKQTPVKRKEPRDKAYYDDKLLDHACPFTIRKVRVSTTVSIELQSTLY